MKKMCVGLLGVSVLLIIFSPLGVVSSYPLDATIPDPMGGKAVILADSADDLMGPIYRSPSTLSASLDNEPPTVTITSPAANDTVSGVVQITGTASDSDGIIHHVEISIDRGPWINATGTDTWHFDWDTYKETNNAHIIWAQSFDGSEYSPAVGITVQVNNVPLNHPPFVNITVPPNGGKVNDTVVVKGVAYDVDNDPLNVTLRVDQGEWRAVGIFVAPPYISWSYTWDTLTVSEGEHILTVRAYDGQAYTSNTSTVLVDNIQNIPPIVTLVSPPDAAYRNGTIIIMGTSFDQEGSVERVEVRIDDGAWISAVGTVNWTFTWDTRLVSDGNHSISVRSFDGQEYSSVVTITLYVDNTSPTTTHSVTGIGGNNGWWRSTTVVTLTATDDISGVRESFYKIDDGLWETYQGSLAIISDGIHLIQYYSIDNLGQREANQSLTLKIDQVPPVTNYTVFPETPDGNNGWYLRSVTITLTRNDSVSWINATQYRVNNGSWGTYNDPVLLDTDGIYIFEYYSLDNAGNQEENHSFQIKIDTTPPLIRITKPRMNRLYIFDRETIQLPFQTRVIGKITIQVTADDAMSQLEKVQYFIDYGTRIDDTTAPFQYEYDASAILIHRHVITAKAFDKAGNTRTADEITLWIFNI